MGGNKLVVSLFRIVRFPAILKGIWPGLVAWSALSPAFAAVDFQRDVKPILAEHCYSCHGAEKHKAGLRLDRKVDAMQGADSGPIIIPRDSAKSVLIEVVTSADPDSRMPSEADPLSAFQIDVLKKWIDEGAPWPDEAVSGGTGRSQHWAFQPPVRLDPPAVRDVKWVRNPIDAFILARLERENVRPSPEAERVALIRRLGFDLLGLPPEPDEVKAFVADRRPDAYDRLVDRLLASPHFGERWGRHWLDLARYADSDGYETDGARPYAYLYRDWVIQAINRDMPFDQFTVEQLAGDLLPQATLEQKVATAFHRQTLVNKEGGVDQEEFRNKAVVDRVSTTGTVWLGLTVGCAECHTHKYDPIKQREFYQLFAFFNNADETELPAASREELARFHAAKAKWDNELVPLRKMYDDYLQVGLAAKQDEWEARGKLDLARWELLDPESVTSLNGAKMTLLPDRSVSASGPNPPTEIYTITAKAPSAPITGFRLEVLPGEDGKSGPGRAVGQLAGRENAGNFVLSEFSLHVEGGGSFRDVDFRRAAADFSQGDWSIEGAIDKDPKTGWAILPQNQRRHVAVFECAEPLMLAPGEKIIFTLEQNIGNQHTIERFRLSATTSPPPLKATLREDLVAAAWHTPRAQRTDRQKAALTEYYRDEVDEEAARLRKPIAAHVAKKPRYPQTEAAVLAERSTPRETHVHLRGDFLNLGDRVEPGTLGALHTFQARTAKPDRLDLARWLMEKENPLTGRVTVNQVWKNLFGRGLVATGGDFGMRGEKPTHPELLDWLATEFPRLGWSRKALIKLIVTSATYRQSSSLRLDLFEKDPLNTLLARQNRPRLEAEIVRDANLAASGLLVKKVGGPSVRPALPADVAALGFAGGVPWRESEGDDRHRRGMYIFFQRTVPYPMLMTFDAPDSNATCERRERSNTPLQALTLLNDPVFFEGARALGRKALGVSGVDDSIRRAFELCLTRSPDQTELALLRRFYREQEGILAKTPENARAILGLEAGTALPARVVEQAAMVTVARTIMNLDEFITRD